MKYAHTHTYKTHGSASKWNAARMCREKKTEEDKIVIWIDVKIPSAFVVTVTMLSKLNNVRAGWDL